MIRKSMALSFACFKNTSVIIIYSCPIKTHHSSYAHICGLLKGVQNCITYSYY